MWPAAGTGFEPSAYTPAGAEAQEGRILANAQWHREHGYPSLWARPGVRMAAAVIAFLVLVFLVAMASTLL